MVTADTAANSLALLRRRSKPARVLSNREREANPARQPHGMHGQQQTGAEHLQLPLRPAGRTGYSALNTAIPPQMVPCLACLARHRGICGVLSDEHLKQLASRIVLRRIKAGRTLQADGEAPVAYAILLRGVVKLTKTLVDGRQQIVGLQFPPEFVGQPFASESHLSAEAVSDVEVCSVPRTVLEDMMKSHPALESRLFRDTLLQLDQARDWLLAIGRKTARERVTGLLHLIAGQLNPSASTEDAVTGEQTFDLPLSRAEMADFLGLTIETVSRQITRLRQDRIISLGQQSPDHHSPHGAALGDRRGLSYASRSRRR